MREKIARAMCPKKDPELNCDDCVQELVCKPRIDALLALFTAETASMREALEAVKKADEYLPKALCEQIDTALKGGK